MFTPLMKQVTDLTINTEERLKGVIDLVFEKAIDEPSFSVAYANMCHCLATLKVPMADKPGTTVNFRKLLLNRCQKEFERDKMDDAAFEKKQKELDSVSEKERLQEELEEAKDKARRRSTGNIKFIGELFKLRMLTEPIMHDCVVKLLKNHDDESLECLCRLLTTIGKDLDFEKAKPRMDQYFHQMEKIVKERKTSSRIRFMLQDVIDLRLHNWVSRRAEQGPKTIEQIHKEAKIEEQEEQRKVHQQLLELRGSVREETWNTVPVTKNSRTIDPSKIPKISKPQMDDKIQLGPARAQLNWMKGSSGGAKASDSGLILPLHSFLLQSHRKVGALWRESGLNWSDFLSEDEDLQSFISEQKLQFTQSDSSSSPSSPSKPSLPPEELHTQLENLLLVDMATDEQIFDWVEANLDESQISSSLFLRALMTAVCKAANTSCRVDTAIIQKRLPVLHKYFNADTERQLQALYALQALIVTLDQPPNLLRMFFDCLYDEDVISEDAFYRWETSKDPAEQQGKGIALKSVTAFFTWLREAEEESEDN
uniref:Eukaryotic translation initiation factor 4 gamma, 3a n=1 Tax=Astyanax mexicanus TaxID=7994 RepID=A0A8B9J3X8_ASTMX